uniref:Cubilin n=1 Tax=Macrostomum lignano TaxID=282301 RepID=A0A1I8JA97_9PLAT
MYNMALEHTGIVSFGSKLWIAKKQPNTGDKYFFTRHSSAPLALRTHRINHHFNSNRPYVCSLFSCDCSRVDFQGDTCSSKIDDCASRPCQHGGRCIDGVRSYTCDCSATDFYGSNCQSRIDDCASNPCSHNATCTDGLRDFSCSCFSGYSGKTCSVDVQDCSPNPCEYKGACLERSNQALYLVENSSLPAPFNDSFSYALAAGFVCLCPEGTYGDTCSINPNDCLDPATNRSVCAHASNCTDGLASFTCHCLPGYEGPTCSVDIDECERSDSRNGAVCKDLVADYACTGCPAEFGGKNCSVRLTGCDSSPCQNNATCEPLLLRELPSPDHGYRCTCKPGWSGPQCNETTLASFNGTSSFSANFTTTADCTFELSFRTSLAHFDLVRLSSHWGDIRVGAHDSSLVLLFFQCLIVCDWSSRLANHLASTDWLTLSISLTNGSATLSRSESGVSQMPGAQLVDGLSDSFKPNSRMSVRVGGESGSGIDGGGFRGCVRDLRLVTNDSTLVATETTAESSNATWGVCSRSVQCGSPSPCEAKTSSMCSDVWNDFVCHCAADFGGLRCSVELPSFSLGVGGSVSSARFASAAGVSSVYGGDSWTIELRLVTLSRGAFLLLLGDPSDSATTPRLLATIDASGRLSAQILYGNGSEIVALTSSNSVATGEYVSVKISLSISDRSLSLSVSSSVRSASLSSASPLPQLSGQLIIGGFSGLLAAPAPPPIESSGTKGRSRRSLPALPTSISSTLSTNLTAFRGIIASPKLNGLKPLILGSVESNVTDLLPGAVAASETESITDGVVNEDVCTNWEPCQKNATCTNVFYNKFSLSASRFNEALTSLTGWARTRELNFRLLSMTNSDGRQLFVEAKSGHLRVSLDNKHAMSDFSIATGFPFTFDVRFFTERRLELSAKFNGTDAATTFSESHDFAPLTLDSAAVVVLGDSGFKGCLGNVRLNGYLVPLVNRSLPSDTPGFSWSATDADSIISPTPGCHGDVVCKTGVCQNSGRCSDMWNKYVCDCKDGFSGPTCSAVASVPSVGAIIGIVAGVVVAAGIIVAIVLVAKFTTLFRPSASSDLQSQSKLDPTTGVRVGHLRSKSAKPVPQERARTPSSLTGAIRPGKRRTCSGTFLNSAARDGPEGAPLQCGRKANPLAWHESGADDRHARASPGRAGYMSLLRYALGMHNPERLPFRTPAYRGTSSSLCTSVPSVIDCLQPRSDEDANELARTRRAACSEGDCKNGGTCWPGPVTSSTPPCLCTEAYTGTYCTVRINFCATTSDGSTSSSNPCQNGGTCSNTDASPWYHCSCVYGYTGG